MNDTNINDIKQLLERYYDGSTSEADERRLRVYFAGDNVADDLTADKDMFLSLSGEGNVSVPDDLGDRISNGIDKWDALEKRRRRFTFRAVLSLAASLAVLMAIGVWFMQQPKTTGQQLSPEEAYAQTEKALQIFARALDKSVDGIETVDRTTEKINSQINTNLQLINDI